VNCIIKRVQAILTEKISEFGNYVPGRRRIRNKASYNVLENEMVYDLKQIDNLMNFQIVKTKEL